MALKVSRKVDPICEEVELNVGQPRNLIEEDGRPVTGMKWVHVSQAGHRMVHIRQTLRTSCQSGGVDCYQSWDRTYCHGSRGYNKIIRVGSDKTWNMGWLYCLQSLQWSVQS